MTAELGCSDSQARRGATLRSLAAAVTVAGLLVAVSSFAVFDRGPADLPLWRLPVFVLLVAIASAAVVRVRLRSAVAGTGWTDAAILVCIVCLPPALVAGCVGVGVLVAKLGSRVSPFKSAYNAGRDVLAATVGVLVAVPLGIAGVARPMAHLWAIVPVALAVATAEHVIGLPILALASATPWRKVLRTNGDIKVASFLGQVTVAILAIWLWQLDPRLLAVIPPVALCLHLLHASRVAARAERAAWQRLAATTEELNDTDLAAVLTAAVVNAATLFSAEQAEVFLRDGPDGPILVRGDPDGLVWSGDPGQAPPRSMTGRASRPGCPAMTSRLTWARCDCTTLAGSISPTGNGSSCVPSSRPCGPRCATQPRSPRPAGSRCATPTPRCTTRSPVWPIAVACTSTVTWCSAGPA